MLRGFAGDRFFPATISTDDPFAASEFSLPTFSEIRQPGPLPVKVFDISTDLSLLHVDVIEPRSKRSNHRPNQPRGYLVWSILPGRSRSNYTHSWSYWAQRRSNRPASL